MDHAWCLQQGADVLLRVKAVPGASRDQIAGLLGDRLKIRVAAPPEGGKANDSICSLLAKALGRSKREIAIDAGLTNPEKSVRIQNAAAGEVAGRLVP